MTLPGYDASKLATPPELEESPRCPDCQEPLDEDDYCDNCQENHAPRGRWDDVI